MSLAEERGTSALSYVCGTSDTPLRGSRIGQAFDATAAKYGELWRKRVGVEPTIRPAKDRIAGFEGRGSHRTPFASGESIAGEEKRIRQEEGRK